VAIGVPERELLAAVHELSAAGFSVEPASALAFAGLKLAQADGLADAAGPAVCVLTSSGLNWTRDLDAVWGGVPRMLDSPAAVLIHARLAPVGPSAAAEADGAGPAAADNAHASEQPSRAGS
jgi:threonine synthase